MKVAESIVNINYDEFLKDYTPSINRVTSGTHFGGCLYGTTGDDFKHIIKAMKGQLESESINCFNVWTLVEKDGLKTINCAYDSKNAIGHFITWKQWNKHKETIVTIL